MHTQVVAAAKAGVYSVGYELNPWLVLYSKFNALVNGVYHHTEFHVKDLFKVCIRVFCLAHVQKKLTMCVCVCVCVCVYVCVCFYK